MTTEAPAGITAAVDSLAVRGRLCVVAVHPVPREMNLHRFFWRELASRAADYVSGVILPVDGGWLGR